MVSEPTEIGGYIKEPCGCDLRFIRCGTVPMVSGFFTHCKRTVSGLSQVEALPRGLSMFAVFSDWQNT